MLNRWNRVAPLTGVVFVGLVVASIFASGSTPGSSASAAKVISFYHAHSTQQFVSGYLAALSVVFGLFFYGSLRGYLRRHAANERLAAIVLAGASIFGAGACLLAGTLWALTDKPTRLSAGAAQALNLLQNDLFAAMMAVGVCTLMVASGLALVRGRLAPTWLGYAALVIGVASVTPIFFVGLIGTGIWTLIMSVVIFRRSTPEVVTLPADANQGGAPLLPREVQQS